MTPPLTPEAVAQMVDRLKDRRASWLGDGSSPDKLCAEAADMLTTIAAENATLRAENEELDFLRHEGGPDSVAAMEIELAMLRASEAAALERVKVLTDAAAHVIHDIDDLAANSEGVTGLHYNGEVAEWGSLMAGGSFGAWLESIETLRAALTADKEPR